MSKDFKPTDLPESVQWIIRYFNQNKLRYRTYKGSPDYGGYKVNKSINQNQLILTSMLEWNVNIEQMDLSYEKFDDCFKLNNDHNNNKARDYKYKVKLSQFERGLDGSMISLSDEVITLIISCYRCGYIEIAEDIGKEKNNTLAAYRINIS